MNKNPVEIRNMFDDIAVNYDKLNSIISFGMHKIIKKLCIKLLNIKSDIKIADLCCGTGDLVEIMQNFSSNIVGIDFSEKMLSIAGNKMPEIQFINASCTDLPLKNEGYDIITMSYGLRNIENRQKALEEIYRVLKTNGKFMHLDFGEKNFAGKIFEFFVLIFAKIFSKNLSAYSYLVESKRDFPKPEILIKEIESMGFKLICQRYFLFKAISCLIFIK